MNTKAAATGDRAIVKTAQRIATILQSDEYINAENIFILIEDLNLDHFPNISDVIIWDALAYGSAQRMFTLIAPSGNFLGEVMLAGIDHDVTRSVIENRMERSGDDLFRNLVRGARYLQAHLDAY